MKVIACLVARMKSTRLPRKALKDIHGKPMLLRLVDRLKMSETIDEIVLCTSTHPDDEILLQKAKEWKIRSVADSERDVLSRFIVAAEQESADAVLRVNGDNVLTDPSTIDIMVEHHKNTSADYTRMHGLPLGITTEVMSTSMLQPLHNSIANPNNSGYMVLYAFDPEKFNCQVLNAPKHLERPYYSVTVDTPVDLENVKNIYNALAEKTSEPNVEDIICYLDSNPSLARLDPGSHIKMPGGKLMTYGDFLKMMNDRALKTYT